ncbi:hypothetical protein [Thalassoroseus pseudoceratinae]|uniref:hypothetical protein n=1 Tax=Thalassoroseus pseudoceratinae TaxID=2713176 RepID=UPI0014231FAA|nr:hypothetical protein [Thalassoroseus pseudoceratinae]
MPPKTKAMKEKAVLWQFNDQEPGNCATVAYLQMLTERRDQQIGHLEALQELIDES